MGKLADVLLGAYERIVYGTPEQQKADARREAMNRAVNCPNCGDANRDVIAQDLSYDGTATRKMCAVVVDMDGSICGCQHHYHAA
jgi:hypothetical protein